MAVVRTYMSMQVSMNIRTLVHHLHHHVHRAGQSDEFFLYLSSASLFSGSTYTWNTYIYHIATHALDYPLHLN